MEKEKTEQKQIRIRQLSEITGDEAMDVLADVMEAVVDIVADDEIAGLWKDKKLMKCVTLILRKFKPEMWTIIQALVDVDWELDKLKNAIDVADLPVIVINIINDPKIQALFPSAAQMVGQNSSGAVMENTQEKDQ